MNIFRQQGGQKLTLGDKMKLARKRIGMTQQEIANAIQTSFSTYRRWEKNQNVPNMKELSKIATVLQTSVSDLCEEPPQVLTQSVSTPGLAYWGEVADNIRALMSSGDTAKIALVKSMLASSLDDNLREHQINTVNEIHSRRDSNVSVGGYK